MNATPAELQSLIELFNREIERQAASLVERHTAERVLNLREAARAFGAEPAIVASVIEVWTDPENRLVPKVVAELVIAIHGGELRHRFEVGIGPLHYPFKEDRLFELCMLRAEAELDLRGQGDGEAATRMRGLARELGIAV